MGTRRRLRCATAETELALHRRPDERSVRDRTQVPVFLVLSTAVPGRCFDALQTQCRSVRLPVCTNIMVPWQYTVDYVRFVL